MFKPHLAVLVPLYFILTRNWRGFIAAGVGASLICLASLAAFGWPAWQGFLAGSALAREALDQNLVGYAKMQSVFGAVRLLGGGVTSAWIVQGLAGGLGVIGLWRLRNSPSTEARGAMLVCATLLTTPFLFDYDLTLLAVPLAFLFRQGRRDGFLAWEKLALAVGFMLPIVSRSLAMFAHAPVGSLVVLAVLACVLRRQGAQAAYGANLLSPLSLRSA